MIQEDIEKINSELEQEGIEDQGIFREPYGIDHEVKVPIIYMRWVKGGMTGGSYDIDSYRHSFEGDVRPTFTVLEKVLQHYGKDISLVDSPEIEKITHESEFDDNMDYYMNYDEFAVEWIILSELEAILYRL